MPAWAGVLNSGTNNRLTANKMANSRRDFILFLLFCSCNVHVTQRQETHNQQSVSNAVSELVSQTIHICEENEVRIRGGVYVNAIVYGRPVRYGHAKMVTGKHQHVRAGAQ